MHAAQRVLVKAYKGKQNEAVAAFQRDSVEMQREDYYPVSQTWSDGSWGCGAFLLAVLACFVVVGLFVLLYMVMTKPAGTLTVTYELRPSAASARAVDSDSRPCPQCAETIKAAALVCRYCGFKLSV